MSEAILFIGCLILVLVMIDIVIRSKSSLLKSADPVPNCTKNKYVEMDYFAFDRLMCWIFAQILEQTAFAYESPNDHRSESDLIAQSISQFIVYFASSNDAIEAAYGEGFLVKWVGLKIGILGNRKLIKTIICQGISSDIIYRSLCINDVGVRGRS